MLNVQWGESPFWLASWKGHQKCVRLLINAGANVDVPKEVSVTSCTHISETAHPFNTSYRASSPHPSDKCWSIGQWWCVVELS